MELSDLLPGSGAGDHVSIRRGRVLSTDKRSAVVELGSQQVTVVLADSCYPVPGQTVLLAVEGSTMTAIASVGGEHKQTTLTLTGNDATTVSGFVNGVPRAVPKLGTFTVAGGDVLPLIWSADGSGVWVGAKPGVTYAPPPPATGGGGGGGGGGGVTSGTATYPASSHGWWWGTTLGTGAIIGQGVSGGKMHSGAYFYGQGRFRELQGRTITAFRINVSRSAGTGAINFYTHGSASSPSLPPAFSNGPVARGGSGWISLPTSMATWLISGSGTGGIGITGDPLVSLQGIPSGTLQFDWRR